MVCVYEVESLGGEKREVFKIYFIIWNIIYNVLRDKSLVRLGEKRSIYLWE